jgi:nucleoside-diphosphate-sugar epimerase
MAGNLPGIARRLKRSISYEGIVRLIADAVLINLAILTSLAARFFYIVAFASPQPNIDYTNTFWYYLYAYGSGAWLLTMVCLIVFALNGFYTYGRFYRGRFKTLVVIQAVSVAYLISGFLIYFFKGLVDLPRGTFTLSWLLVTLYLVGARLWAFLWSNVMSAERSLREKPQERRIRSVCVIGGAGYIGSALLPKLLDKGYRVNLLDLLLYGNEPIQEYLNHPRLKVMQADFRQVDAVVEATRDVDAVIHLGGIVGDPACAIDEDLTLEINLMATRMIAEVAKGSGVNRFIFASTCSVYGTSDQKLDERSELNPVSLYARSKIASEKVLLKMADESFAPVILRLGTVYGLSGRTRFDLVVNLLTAKAVVDGQITIFGGDQWRPFLHVDDAALALLQALEAPLPAVRDQVFNVGSNEQNYTIRQIGEIIHGIVPAAEVVPVNTDYDPRNYWVSFDKARKTLGFTPQWSVEQGAQQVIQAIQSGKVQDYKDAKYSNVKFYTEEGIFRLTRTEGKWAYQLLNENAPGVEVVVDL